MSLGALIPQIFYDCIARLIPGLAIMGTVFLVWWDELASQRCVIESHIEITPFYAGMAIVLCAYVIALVLEGLRRFKPKDWLPGMGKRTDCQAESPGKAKRKEEQWCDCEEKFKTAFDIPKETRIPRVSQAIAIDLIRMENPDSGSRIVKLKAEIAALWTLFIGWLMVSAVYTVSVIVSRSVGVEVLIKIAALMIAIVCIRSRRLDLRKKRTCALYNHWLIISSKFKPGNPNIDSHKPDPDG